MGGILARQQGFPGLAAAFGAAVLATVSVTAQAQAVGVTPGDLVAGLLPDLSTTVRQQTTRQIINAVNTRYGGGSGAPFDVWATASYNSTTLKTNFADILSSAKQTQINLQKQQLGITSDEAFHTKLDTTQIIAGGKYVVSDAFAIGAGFAYADFKSHIDAGAYLAQPSSPSGGVSGPLFASTAMPGSAWSAFGYGHYTFAADDAKTVFATVLFGYNTTKFGQLKTGGDNFESKGVFAEASLNGSVLIDEKLSVGGRVGYRYAGNKTEGNDFFKIGGVDTLVPGAPTNNLNSSVNSSLIVIGGDATFVGLAPFEPYVRAAYEIGLGTLDRSNLQVEAGVTYDIGANTRISAGFQATALGQGVSGVGGLIGFGTRF